MNLVSLFTRPGWPCNGSNCWITAWQSNPFEWLGFVATLGGLRSAVSHARPLWIPMVLCGNLTCGEFIGVIDPWILLRGKSLTLGSCEGKPNIQQWCLCNPCNSISLKNRGAPEKACHQSWSSNTAIPIIVHVWESTIALHRNAFKTFRW